MIHIRNASIESGVCLTLALITASAQAQVVAPRPVVVPPATPLPSVAPAGTPGAYYAMPAWDQTLPCVAPTNCPRFVVLSNMNNAAVLDLNTGLVWERSPSVPMVRYWQEAPYFCTTAVTGGVMGWRLPRLQEMATLLDLTVALAPGVAALPPGHPFTGVNQDIGYWTASASVTAGPSAWRVVFRRSAPPFRLVATYEQSSSAYGWCVRGGQGGTDAE